MRICVLILLSSLLEFLVLDLADSHRKLIEETVRTNDRYYGNEDLLEAFCSDVYKKSDILLDSVSNVDNLKTYLEKVADTSISSILRQNGRDVAPKQKPDKDEIQMDILDNPNVKNKIISETNITKTELERARMIQSAQGNRPQNLKEEKIVSLKVDSQGITGLSRDIFADIEDPKLAFPDSEIKENVVKRILGIVYELHIRYPEKNYFEIFYSRHARLKKQANIANELKITQGELSKRYFELIKLIKEQL